MKGKKNKIAESKDKTLIGLIMQSETSGAVYYWKRGDDKAEIILGAKDRPKGKMAPFPQTIYIDEKNNITIKPHGIHWTVLKEIHK